MVWSHVPKVPAEGAPVVDSRRREHQRLHVDAVDERLDHLVPVAFELVQQWFEPADVHLGVGVEEDDDGRCSKAGSYHTRHDQTAAFLVSDQFHVRKKVDVALDRLLQRRVEAHVINCRSRQTRNVKR